MVLAWQMLLRRRLLDYALRLLSVTDPLDVAGFVSLGTAAIGSALHSAYHWAGGTPGSAGWTATAAQAQQPYLRSWAEQVTAAPGISQDAMSARADLYTGQVWAAYQRGQVDGAQRAAEQTAHDTTGAAATAAPDIIITWHVSGGHPPCALCAEKDGQEYTQDTLPGYPGDGGFGDLCMGGGNCRCYLTTRST